jgi:hypothetical protein
MPSIDEIQTQVQELPTKAVEYVKTAQTAVVEYVGKAAVALADLVPADAPEAVSVAINGVVYEANFVKSVIDAAVKPFAPAKK